jgi:NADH-quinone oxidoreductase subunit F
MEKVLHRFEHGDATPSDIDLLYNVASNIEGNTICALGDAAAWPVKGFIEKFRDEFEARCKPSRSIVSLNVVHGRRATSSKLVTTLS